MDKEIVISMKVVLFSLALLLGVYVLYKLFSIIILLLVSTIIVIALERGIEFFMGKTLMNKPVSRNVAVLFTYFLLILTISGVFTVVLPPVASQGKKLAVNLTSILSDLEYFKNSETTLSDFMTQFTDVSGDVVSTTVSVFTSVLGFMSILIISIYMSLDWENIKKRLYSLFAGRLQDEVKKTVVEIEDSIGNWLKGQLFLMIVVGLVSFVGLKILGIEFPLALGMAAGLLEIVPVLGPIIALLLAGIVGFSESVPKGLAAVALFTVIQQVENNFLVPKVMHRVSGFSPLVILIALLVGGSLLGVIGAIIAVPVMMISVIVFKHVIRYSE